ncbi:MAG TPA: hypothetical protein VFK07_00735 [Candidatus Paceibacterota bacterium]|nr:hypothetical protein [Candidatus Paceibacterota bacterium]
MKLLIALGVAIAILLITIAAYYGRDGAMTHSFPSPSASLSPTASASVGAF